MVCKRIQVYGKVQGVFFRATSKTMADDLKLAGWVKNEADGTVLLEVEGPEALVEKMLDWCRQGPTFSRVDDVLDQKVALKDYKGFQIRY